MCGGEGYGGGGEYGVNGGEGYGGGYDENGGEGYGGGEYGVNGRWGWGGGRVERSSGSEAEKMARDKTQRHRQRQNDR